MCASCQREYVWLPVNRGSNQSNHTQTQLRQVRRVKGFHRRTRRIATTRQTELNAAAHQHQQLDISSGYMRSYNMVGLRYATSTSSLPEFCRAPYHFTGQSIDIMQIVRRIERSRHQIALRFVIICGWKITANLMKFDRMPRITAHSMF